MSYFSRKDKLEIGMLGARVGSIAQLALLFDCTTANHGLYSAGAFICAMSFVLLFLSYENGLFQRVAALAAAAVQLVLIIYRFLPLYDEPSAAVVYALYIFYSASVILFAVSCFQSEHMLVRAGALMLIAAQGYCLYVFFSDKAYYFSHFPETNLALSYFALLVFFWIYRGDLKRARDKDAEASAAAGEAKPPIPEAGAAQ